MTGISEEKQNKYNIKFIYYQHVIRKVILYNFLITDIQ